MDFSVDFFRDEVRNGFYIPTAIKQEWAASMQVLYQIDLICKRHNISYYADWGTLLGAVRHGGFIPWDDDLDICMKREDYNRFRAVADKELPPEFMIHDYKTKEDHWLFLARVVSHRHICFDKEHLEKYHNFPYMVSVDIFLLDYLYKDENEEKKRCEEVKHLIAVADGIVENNFRSEVVESELSKIEKRYNVRIGDRHNRRSVGIALYELAEKQMARVNERDADEIGQIFPWILKGQKGYPKKYYEKAVLLPFENMTIPVPQYYNDVLRHKYGEYLYINKIWGGHDYPYYEKQRENLKAVADFDLPEYTFNADKLKRQAVDNNDSLKTISEECVVQMEEMNLQLVDSIKNGDVDDVLTLLPECQQLSVDLGTLIEEIKGTDRECCQRAVEDIQAYCDALYAVYLKFTGEEAGEDKTVSEDENDVINCFDHMVDTVKKQIIERGEILLLPTGPGEWNGLEDVYKTVRADDNMDVYVVPLPVLYKDAYGYVNSDDDEIMAAAKQDEYPDDVKLTLWTDYDISLHRPDVIYIQNPYDGENPCLTVPAQYYAENVRNYTNELVYIPAFKVDDFCKEDYNDMYNMKHYVTAPGVILADTVLVQSDEMRKLYIDKLAEFAGEDTRNMWKNKIKVSQMPVCSGDGDAGSCESRDEADNKVNIIYGIGLNELVENGSRLVDSVRERLEILKETEDSLGASVCLFPSDINEWETVDKTTAGELELLLDEYRSCSWFSEIQYNDAIGDIILKNYDAYYGSPSPIVPLFVHDEKPVMISVYDN